MKNRRSRPQAVDVLYLLPLFFLSPPTFASTSSIIDVSTLWENAQVPVCFGSSKTEILKNASLYRDLAGADKIVDHSPYESRVRSLLEREYTSARTGIHFVGFDDCDSIDTHRPDAPAFIFADLKLAGEYGISSVGDEGAKLRDKDRTGLLSGSLLSLRAIDTDPNYSVAKLARALAKAADSNSDSDAVFARAKKIDADLVDDIVDTTILHEIGHLAGLEHEERRKDAKEEQPSWCRNAGDRGDQEPDHEKTFGTEFDPFSVMNYCSDDVAKGFALYHLICAFPDLAAKAAERSGKSSIDWASIQPYCSFMKRNYPVGLSARDQAVLRHVYAKEPVPSGASRSYRADPDELQTFKALDALYGALPNTLYSREELVDGVIPSRR